MASSTNIHLCHNFRRVFSTVLIFAAFLISPRLHGQQDSLSALFAEAMAHYRTAEAVDIGEQRLGADSSDQSLVLDLVSAYSRAGMREEAVSCLESGLAYDSTQAVLWFKLARLRENDDNPKKAVQAYHALFKNDSTNSYFYGRAAAFSRKIGYMWLATTWYEKVIGLDPDKVEPYLAKAETQMEMRAFYPADQTIARALKIDSLHPRTLFLAGKSANLQQDHTDADFYFTKLFAQGDGSALAARYYGLSLYHLKRYPESIDMMQVLIDEAPDLDFPYYYRGLCYREMGEDDLAEKAFQKAIDLIQKDNLATYHEQLGLLYQSQNKHRQAIHHLQTARNLGEDPDRIYHLAISYDAFYADKSVALRTYEAYLETADSTAEARTNYARSRRDALLKEAHFQQGN